MVHYGTLIGAWEDKYGDCIVVGQAGKKLVLNVKKNLNHDEVKGFWDGQGFDETTPSGSNGTTTWKAREFDEKEKDACQTVKLVPVY